MGAALDKPDPDTMPLVPVVLTLTMYTCPVPAMDADSIHLDHTPTMEASFTMTVPFTDMKP